MLKEIVSIIIVATVWCDQEHLTCLRTAQILNQQYPRTPQRALQGSPGKRGPKGQAGSRGSPGQKGKPGIPDHHQITSLRNQFNSLFQEVEALKNRSSENQQNERINSLSQEVEALKNRSRKNRQLVVDVFGKALYLPPHIYIYQLTPGRLSWGDSYTFCENWGGNLAVYGVKTLENRKKLIQNLSIKSWFWIGAGHVPLPDGNWYWVNLDRANSSELIWRKGEPNYTGRDSHCLSVNGNLTHSDVGLASSDECGWLRRGLCEKQI